MFKEKMAFFVKHIRNGHTLYQTLKYQCNYKYVNLDVI
jgi:hypothetical protein